MPTNDVNMVVDIGRVHELEVSSSCYPVVAQ